MGITLRRSLILASLICGCLSGSAWGQYALPQAQYPQAQVLKGAPGVSIQPDYLLVHFSNPPRVIGYSLPQNQQAAIDLPEGDEAKLYDRGGYALYDMGMRLAVFHPRDPRWVVQELEGERRGEIFFLNGIATVRTDKAAYAYLFEQAAWIEISPEAAEHDAGNAPDDAQTSSSPFTGSVDPSASQGITVNIPALTVAHRAASESRFHTGDNYLVYDSGDRLVAYSVPTGRWSPLELQGTRIGDITWQENYALLHTDAMIYVYSPQIGSWAQFPKDFTVSAPHEAELPVHEASGDDPFGD